MSLTISHYYVRCVQSSELSWTEAAFLSVWDRIKYHKPPPTNRGLAKLLGMSVRALQYMKARLKKKGHMSY